MCINLGVRLPTVGKFLLLYSLRCGSTLVLIWTSIRSLLCLLFFVFAIMEVFVGYDSPFGAVIIHKRDPKPTNDDNIFFVFYSYIPLLVAEAFLFFHTIYLAVAIYSERSRLLEPYLTCRFCVWLVELVFLFILCLTHKLLIGWYLGMLLFVFLEVYCFVVVYSYYVDLVANEMGPCLKSTVDPCESYN